MKGSLAKGCAIGVAVLATGAVAYATIPADGVVARAT